MRYAPEDEFIRPVTDLPLFAPEPKARVSDPQPSHDAATSMSIQAGIQREQILLALARLGPMTADELDHELEYRPTTAGRRLKELLDLKLIEFTGGTRPTRSKRQANVYRRRSP